MLTTSDQEITVLTRCRHLLGLAVVAAGLALWSAFGGAPAPGVVPEPGEAPTPGVASAPGAALVGKAHDHSRSSAFCRAYRKLNNYQPNTSSLRAFRRSLHHLRSLVLRTEKVSPPSVKAHLESFLKHEAALKSIAGRAASYQSFKHSAKALRLADQLNNDGAPVDNYASSHCKS